MCKIRKVFIYIIILIFIFILSTGCSNKRDSELILATGTTVVNSGLLSEIIPEFTTMTGIKVKVLALGTGQALKNAKEGNVDVLLIHSKEDELKFVNDGYGVKRYDLMYNYFIFVGPAHDPDGMKKYNGDISMALKHININNIPFISRGDNSGTHKLEKKIWNELGIDPSNTNYFETGRGMSAVLFTTHEMNAYTISDEATFYSMKEQLDMVELVRDDKKLLNQYGLIKVIQKSQNRSKESQADEFINWLLSKKTLRKISEFGKNKYGKSLYMVDTIKMNGKNE